MGKINMKKMKQNIGTRKSSDEDQKLKQQNYK